MGKQKSVSQKGIAEHLGISVSTVSRSLNNEPGIGNDLRAKVRATAVELGYPLDGKALVGRAGTVLTAIIPLAIMPTGASGFHQAILNAIEEEAKAQRVPFEAFFIHDAARYADEIAAIAMDEEARRLLLVGIDQPAVISSVKQLGIPCLIVNGRDELMEVPGIAPANERGAALACQHLIDLGHRDIAICSAAYRSTLRARILGFRNALERAGLPFQSSNFIEIDRVSWEDAYAAVSGHLEAHGQTFTAILCGNDMVAIGVIKALNDYGIRVPEDCSVVGFDGVSAGVPVRPTLATVAIDCAALGKLAVQSLMSISTSGPVTDQEISCSLRVGQSTGAAPSHSVAQSQGV